MTTTSKSPEAARAFEEYALSEPAQAQFAAWGYRPVNETVLQANASKFPEPSGLFTIDRPRRLVEGERRALRPGGRLDREDRRGRRSVDREVSTPVVTAGETLPHAGREDRRGAARAPSVARPGPLALGVVTMWLSLIVLLPLAAVFVQSLDNGLDGFWAAVTNRQAVAALRFTLVVSLVVAAINAVFGTLIAWVLVRDEFPGKQTINALIDLPFALPTIVAGIVLLALYGDDSPVGVDIAFTQAAVALALLFVTLPFVVRSVQPVLIELDREMEAAAASLGRLAPGRSSAASCSRTCGRRSSAARRSRSPAPSASSARSS